MMGYLLAVKKLLGRYEELIMALIENVATTKITTSITITVDASSEFTTKPIEVFLKIKSYCFDTRTYPSKCFNNTHL